MTDSDTPTIFSPLIRLHGWITKRRVWSGWHSNRTSGSPRWSSGSGPAGQLHRRRVPDRATPKTSCRTCSTSWWRRPAADAIEHVTAGCFAWHAIASPTCSARRSRRASAKRPWRARCELLHLEELLPSPTPVRTRSTPQRAAGRTGGRAGRVAGGTARGVRGARAGRAQLQGDCRRDRVSVNTLLSRKRMRAASAPAASGHLRRIYESMRD